MIGSNTAEPPHPDQTSPEGRSQGVKKPRLVPLVACIGGVVIVLLVAALLLMGKSLSDIVNLASDTRHHHLPEVLERQRTAINVERLGRFGEIIVSTEDKARRRNTRLAAQVLAQDSAFEKDPVVHAMVWEAFDAIRDIAAMRDSQDAARRNLHEYQERISSAIEWLQGIKTVQVLGDRLQLLTRLVSQLQTLRYLVYNVEQTGSEAELEALRERFDDERTAQKAVARSLSSQMGVPFAQELERLLGEVDETFVLQSSILQQEERSRMLWLEAVSILEELTDKLSLGAAATASTRMENIENAAKKVKRGGYIVILGMMLVMLVLVLLFKQFIVQPIVQASRGLDRVRAGKGPVTIPEARIMELDAIGEAVERFDKTLLQLKKTNAKLHQLSMQDGLTGIANRRYFDEAYQQEWKRSFRHKRPLSVLLIDIDQFKLYNDTYGHQNGDDALKRVARILQASTGRPGDVVARYGGEEFVVVLPETNGSGARQIAEKLRQEVNRLEIPHKASPVEPWLTVSVGVASVTPEPGLTREDLLERADKALLKAKREGRNTVKSWS